MENMDWKAEGSRVVCKGAWRLVVAVVPSQDDPIPTADARAHTKADREEAVRLIAAAPALLAALDGVLADVVEQMRRVDAIDPNTPAMCRARAAVRLAREGRGA